MMRSLMLTLLLLNALNQAQAHTSSTDNAGIVEEGTTVYQQYCASCHGAQGEGMPNWEEQNEQGELPAPPHGPKGHTWKHSDAMLFRIISEGWRDPWNQTQRLTMPAFGDVLTPHQIRAVVTYLKTLWTPEQRQYQAEESRGEPFPPENQ